MSDPGPDNHRTTYTPTQSVIVHPGQPNLGSMIVGIEGDDKSGKTTLALTAPRSLWHIDLDVGGFRRASHRFQGIPGISSTPYYLPRQAVVGQLRQGQQLALGSKAPSVLRPTQILVGYRELWYKLLSDYADHLEDPSTRTIVFDSFPQVWELCRFGYLQELQEKNPGKPRESLIQIEYGEPNARMRQLLYAARQMDKNLVLTHYLTEEYQDKLVDGTVKSVVVGIKHAGWKFLDKEADVVVRTRMQWDTDPDTRAKKLTPYATIRINGMALEATGAEMREPTWDKISQHLAIYRG